MTPFEHQAKIKAQIFGSYSNATDCIKKSEEVESLDKKEDTEKVESEEAK